MYIYIYIFICLGEVVVQWSTFGHANLGFRFRSSDIRWPKTTQIAAILSSDGTNNVYRHMRL